MYIELMTVRGICAGYDGMPEDNVMKVSVRKKKKSRDPKIRPVLIA